MALSSLRKLYKVSNEGRFIPTKGISSSTLTSDNSTIQINNSFSELQGFSEEALDQVAKRLTYKNEAIAHEKVRYFRILSRGKSSGNQKMVGFAKHKIRQLEAQETVCWLRGTHFPTGLLEIVKETLSRAKFAYSLSDKRKVPLPKHTFRWVNPPPPMRYYQEEMVEAALKQGRGVIEAAVGTGKTLVCMEIIKRLEVDSLIILPSAALVEQTRRTMESAFGKRKVGTLNSAAIKANKAMSPITLTTIQTLASLNKKGLIEKVVRDLDLIVVDEVHHSGAKSYTDLLPHIDHVYFRIGLTGTFLRADSKTLDMWGFLSNVLYTLPAWKAIKEGYLTPVDFHIHSLPGNGRRNYQTEYRINYCGGTILLEKILEIVESIPSSEQTLILVDRKESSGKVIHEFLTDRGYENVYISGDDSREHIADSIQSFNEKKINILIGSTVIGEGVDIYSTQHLILARGGKSATAIIQAIGRAVRLDDGKEKAIVHDCEFTDTNFLQKHSRQRCEFYKDYFHGALIYE